MAIIKRLYLITFLSLPLVPLTGCSEDPVAKSGSGKDLFSQHCAPCHQTSGGGKFLKAVPANKKTRLSRDDIIELIRYGKADHDRMPAIRNLSYKEAGRIADHLIKLRNKYYDN